MFNRKRTFMHTQPKTNSGAVASSPTIAGAQTLTPLAAVVPELRVPPTGAMQQMLSVQATPEVDGIRTAKLFTQEHTVIPCVALVEGVLWPANAAAPELALAEEFGRFPDGWNGRPVTLDHPKIEGIPVSANTPGVLDDTAIGQLFNTRLVDNKLKTEIWINNARVEALGDEGQQAVARLLEGDEIVEVSTGLFTMQELVSGEYGGQEYSSVWRNIVPDHLAILPQGITGACSVEDGCGAPRVNNKYQMEPVMRAAQMKDLSRDSSGSGEAPVINGCQCQSQQEGQQGIFQKLIGMAGGLLNFRDSQGMSDRDLRMALDAALGTTEQDEFFFIMAVFQDGEESGRVVYELGFGGDLYSREFSIGSDGNITLGGEKQQVRPVTQFVPVEVTTNSGSGNDDDISQEENAMDREKFIKGLISNEATKFTEDDQEFLDGLTDEQLQKLEPNEVEDPAEANASDGEGEEEEPKRGKVEVKEDPEPLPAAASSGKPAKPQTTDEYIKNAPAEIREVLQEGLRMQRSHKDALVKGLLANKRNKFTEDQLRGKPLQELEYLAELARDVSYEGAGATLATNSGSEDDDDMAPPPPVLFPRKTEDAA